LSGHEKFAIIPFGFARKTCSLFRQNLVVVRIKPLTGVKSKAWQVGTNLEMINTYEYSPSPKTINTTGI